MAGWWPAGGPRLPVASLRWPVDGRQVARWWLVGGPLVARGGPQVARMRYRWPVGSARWLAGGPLVARWWPVGGSQWPVDGLR